jgi:hypothetical protein
MRNYWTTLKYTPAASWYVTFPPVAEVGIESFLRFARGLLDAGEREQVYRVLETRTTGVFQATPEYSYYDHLVEVFKATGILPLFDHGTGVGSTEAGRLRTPGRVAYYDPAGKVVEENVDDLGLLLQHLRPEKAAHHLGYMSHVAPVTVTGLTKISSIGATASMPISISLTLDTDIWFPRVVGFLDSDDDAPSPSLSEMHDNRVLASRHTPRLNRFLTEVHSLVVELNGRWTLTEPEEQISEYRKMRREDGIEIDLPSAL